MYRQWCLYQCDPYLDPWIQKTNKTFDYSKDFTDDDDTDLGNLTVGLIVLFRAFFCFQKYHKSMLREKLHTKIFGFFQVEHLKRNQF